MYAFRERLNDAIKDVKIHGNYAAFWGSVFSNFYPCNILIDNRWFNCSEQYFMYKKAMHFNDVEIAEEIMKTSDPKEIKKLGRKVRNYDDEEWSNVRYDIMLKGVYSKFVQNPICMLSILNEKFDGKAFVEGNPHDKIWSCGLDYRDSKIANRLDWQGKNDLGIILDCVRFMLQTDNFLFHPELKRYDELTKTEKE